MKRRPQREIYADTIALARDRQDLETRHAAQQAGREQAAIDIQRMVRANAGRQQAGHQIGHHTPDHCRNTIAIHHTASSLSHVISMFIGAFSSYGLST